MVSPPAPEQPLSPPVAKVAPMMPGLPVGLVEGGGVVRDSFLAPLVTPLRGGAL